MAVLTRWILLPAIIAAAAFPPIGALAQVNSTNPAVEEAQVEGRTNAFTLAYRLAPAIAIVAGLVGFIIWKQKLRSKRR